MLNKIKEFFDAYYDFRTDTIHNCTPHTFIWYHEDRHRQQYKTMKWLPTAKYAFELLRNSAHLLLVAAAMLSSMPLAKMALIPWFAWFIFETLLEVDANFIAFLRVLRRNKQ